MEDVEVRVGCQVDVGDPGSLVVTWDDQDRDPGLRYLEQRAEGLKNEGSRNPGPVEEISGVYHQVHSSSFGWFQGSLMARLKVVATPAALDASPGREVETQMGVGQEKDTKGSGRLRHSQLGRVRDKDRVR
jgi:hypothetical protein